MSGGNLNAFLNAHVLGSENIFNPMQDPTAGISVLDALSIMPVGTMLADKVSTDGVTWRTALFVKMNEMNIWKLGHIPLFDFKPDLVLIDNIAVVVLMMAIRGKRWLTGTYLNYFSTGGDTVKNFIDLASLDTITLSFVNERNKIVRSIEFENKVKNAFKSYIDTIQLTQLKKVEGTECLK